MQSELWLGFTLGVMRLCWLLLVVLGCRPSRAAPSPSIGALQDVQTASQAGCSGTALILCPSVTGKTLRFNLLRGDERICNCTCQVQPGEQDCSAQCSPDVKPHKSREGRFAGFNVTVSKTPVRYSCEAAVISPPPLKKSLSDAVVPLLVEGHQCGSNQDGSTGDGQERRSGTWLWIWILVVVSLSVYGLAVTVLASVCWTKLRRTELQNDYMNAKPRVQRAPKKKRGIQNPIPRYF
ncbi:uncharacterized protein LOC115383773 [Salarias fasciatus]|uniref:uncharacterized protein LOC115383772 n=1 Tax=Salarias fasciatus TaxID=181472 RepID=UPI001176E694|nr:uncharacterized protein LOC115383772 [Salarias fasciatus]XP_029941811.1 uncharacterized protein LOC115383773 [Salarias fasciatus]